jgi:guanosine-3',5'-bis(diphosphate) 3'-pyrophosphohydrolase
MQPVLLLRALVFAADKHRNQKRKGAEASPYINHLIAVAAVLADAGVADETLLVAAVLHDTIEDTNTTYAELESTFGPEVAGLVQEVTDDKSLDKAIRKKLQIQNAQALSARAKQLKIADKISNIRDITHFPPADWPIERRREYLGWAEQVVAGCRGINPQLDRVFDSSIARARTAVAASSATPDSDAANPPPRDDINKRLADLGFEPMEAVSEIGFIGGIPPRKK